MSDQTVKKVTVNDRWMFDLPKGFKFCSEGKIAEDGAAFIMLEDKEENKFEDYENYSTAFIGYFWKEPDGISTAKKFAAHKSIESRNVVDKYDLFVAYDHCCFSGESEYGSDEYRMVIGTEDSFSDIQIRFGYYSYSHEEQIGLIDAVAESISLVNAFEGEEGLFRYTVRLIVNFIKKQQSCYSRGLTVLDHIRSLSYHNKSDIIELAEEQDNYVENLPAYEDIFSVGENEEYIEITESEPPSPSPEEILLMENGALLSIEKQIREIIGDAEAFDKCLRQYEGEDVLNALRECLGVKGSESIESTDEIIRFTRSWFINTREQQQFDEACKNLTKISNTPVVELFSSADPIEYDATMALIRGEIIDSIERCGDFNGYLCKFGDSKSLSVLCSALNISMINDSKELEKKIVDKINTSYYEKLLPLIKERDEKIEGIINFVQSAELIIDHLGVFNIIRKKRLNWQIQRKLSQIEEIKREFNEKALMIDIF